MDICTISGARMSCFQKKRTRTISPMKATHDSTFPLILNQRRKASNDRSLCKIPNIGNSYSTTFLAARLDNDIRQIAMAVSCQFFVAFALSAGRAVRFDVSSLCCVTSLMHPPLNREEYKIHFGELIRGWIVIDKIHLQNILRIRT